ncbi:hypothetical protein ABGB19_07430 [Mycobacterium sp. B14F4]|uniref:hypothetical protein n=1 Tax=Mycobacterium sp. B14F4 TaxID=3153565 RepID=UPI00325F088E
MTPHRRQRAISAGRAAKIAVAGVAVGLGTLVPAGTASAQPAVPPLPTPVPGAPAPPPGQPYAVGVEQAAPPPAPPPVGPPPVPEIANPQYGQGSSPGPLGFLRDAWHQAQDPYGFTSMPPGQLPAGAPPPPGAGPAPQLPPGYTSLTAPESNGPPVAPKTETGPPLPPGYYPLDGPPPPGYFDAPPPAPPPAPAPPPMIYAGPTPTP